MGILYQESKVVTPKVINKKFEVYTYLVNVLVKEVNFCSKFVCFLYKKITF